MKGVCIWYIFGMRYAATLLHPHERYQNTLHDPVMALSSVRICDPVVALSSVKNVFTRPVCCPATRTPCEVPLVRTACTLFDSHWSSQQRVDPLATVPVRAVSSCPQYVDASCTRSACSAWQKVCVVGAPSRLCAAGRLLRPIHGNNFHDAHDPAAEDCM